MIIRTINHRGSTRFFSFTHSLFFVQSIAFFPLLKSEIFYVSLNTLLTCCRVFSPSIFKLHKAASAFEFSMRNISNSRKKEAKIRMSMRLVGWEGERRKKIFTELKSCRIQIEISIFLFSTFFLHICSQANLTSLITMNEKWFFECLIRLSQPFFISTNELCAPVKVRVSGVRAVKIIVMLRKKKIKFFSSYSK